MSATRRSSRVQDHDLSGSDRKRYREDGEDDEEEPSSSSRRPSSSRAVASSSSSRRNVADSDPEEDEYAAVTRLEGPDRLQFSKKCKYTLADVKLEANANENMRFTALDRDIRDRCVREISRLFLFKGTKKEVINRENISDILRKIDESYKGHVNAVVEEVQDVLFQTTGYLVIRSDKIRGVRAKKDKTYVSTYYLHNSLQSAVLLNAINDANANKLKENSFSGFMFVVFHAIFNSPAGKVSIQDLLHAVRKIDTRFPSTLTSMTSGKTGIIDEFDEDFIGLLNRMKKEHYILWTKETGEGNKEADKNFIEFGPRFFLEVGKEALLHSYFLVIGEPMDENLLREIQKEEKQEEEEDNEDQ